MSGIITGDRVRLFHYLQLIHGLTLEINTGMKVSARGSVMVAAKRTCGSPKQTKKGVLGDMVAYAMSEFPDYHPADNVLRAMNRKFLRRTEVELEWLRDLGSGSPFLAPGVEAPFPDKVMFELHMLGAILPDLDELASDKPRHVYRVQTITDDMLRLASHH